MKKYSNIIEVYLKDITEEINLQRKKSDSVYLSAIEQNYSHE